MPAQKPKYYGDCYPDEGYLWERLKSGDKVGLEEIYLKYSPDLFRYGMAIKPNRSLIKDCIQELFIDLWKYREGLNHTDSVRLYLIRCLSNRINKEIAKERRFISDSEISTFESAYLEESIEERVINVQRDEDLQIKLKRGLERLPARQREVIQLLFFEKRTYEEISKVLGINVESSYTLAWKALRSLKKTILILIFWMISTGG